MSSNATRHRSQCWWWWKTISLIGVNFATNKGTLTPHAEGVLEHAVEVRVEGHTDNTGSEHYNLALSQKRAEAVVDYLVGQDINKDHIVAIGMGEAHPVASNDTVEGRAQNRRVDFVVSQ